MERSKNDCYDHRDGTGYLPGCAPLAVPFVPMQTDNPPKYEAKKGLIRGTLFPGLDLPFMGMVNEKELSDSPLHDLQAIEFAIQELALYLDTHREDMEAQELYRAYQELYTRCTEKCQEKYGPMNHFQIGDGQRYRWLDDPWPWDYTPKKNQRR